MKKLLSSDYLWISKLFKLFLKALPYLLALVIGVIIFILSGKFNSSFSDLLINISAAFISVPLLYLFYEIVKSSIHRKLNLEIFEYSKMQVDRDVLGIINQLLKIIYKLGDHELSENKVNEILKYSHEQLREEINLNEYIGFQVFKDWDASERSLHQLLSNPYIASKMEDDQVISLLKILKSLRDLEDILKLNDLYVSTNKKTNKYKLVHGKELNPENDIYPDRYLLLLPVGKNNYKVMDFGDIKKYNLEKSLIIYKVNKKYATAYSSVIFTLLQSIKYWFEMTGHEVLIDTKMYKLKSHFKKSSF